MNRWQEICLAHLIEKLELTTMALQFYADEANYKQFYVASKGFSVSEVLCDNGYRARLALMVTAESHSHKPK